MVLLEVAVFDSLLVLLDILAIRQLEAGYRVKIMFCRSMAVSTIGDLLGYSFSFPYLGQAIAFHLGLLQAVLA